jgi:hypothetical protein
MCEYYFFWIHLGRNSFESRFAPAPRRGVDPIRWGRLFNEVRPASVPPTQCLHAPMPSMPHVPRDLMLTSEVSLEMPLCGVLLHRSGVRGWSFGELVVSALPVEWRKWVV